MPLGPSHTLPAGPRSPIFVGREAEIKVFEDAFWNPQPPEQYRILSLHGLGGQGKTALLEAYRRWLSKANVTQSPCATIDLDDGEQREIIPALISCRNGFAEQGVGTIAFDCAFARYHASMRPGRDIRVDYPEFFKFGPGIIGDLLELTNDVFLHWPGAGLLKKALSRLGADVTRWYRSRGQSLLEHLEGLDASTLRAELPMFLGADLHRRATEHPNARPIILVDGYERLWSDHPGGNGSDAADLWLRRLVEEAPGCLFVVAGRRPIRWPRLDREWGEVVQVHEILDLGEEDVDQWFDRAGVVEAPVRQRIKQSAKGYPLFITLQLSSYWKIKARGKIPHPEDFPSSHKDVIDRFLGHLEAPLRSIYQVVAVPRQFDRDLWAHLQRSGLLSLEQYGFNEVAEEAFFQGLDPERRIMHPVVRSHLLAALEAQNPELLRRVRLAVFDYLDRASSLDPVRREPVGIPDRSRSLSARDACLAEAADLLEAANPGGFVSWCIHRLHKDLSAHKRTSHLRTELLSRASKMVGNDPGQRIALAMLYAQTTPFSGQAEALLEGTFIKDVKLDGATCDDLHSTVLFLTRAGRKLQPTTLAGQIRTFLEVGTLGRLRLALLDGDPGEALQNAELLVQKGGFGRWGFDLLGAAALAGNKTFALRLGYELLEGAVKQKEHHLDELLRLADACRFFKACLLFCRPAWGLSFLECTYSVSGQSQLLRTLENLQGRLGDCLAGLVIEALVALGEHESASSFLHRRLTQEHLIAMEEFVSCSVGLEEHALINEWRLVVEKQPELDRVLEYVPALLALGGGPDKFRNVGFNVLLLRCRMVLTVNPDEKLMLLCNDPLTVWSNDDPVFICGDRTEGWVSNAAIGNTPTLTIFPDAMRLIGQGAKVLIVLVADQKPVLGFERDVVSVESSQTSHVRNELLEAQRAAGELYRTAAMNRLA